MLLFDISHLTMTDLAAALLEYQYDTPPPDLQAHDLSSVAADSGLAAKTAFERPSQHFRARFDQTGFAAPSTVVYLFASVLRHIRAALGGMAANRRIRSRIAQYGRRCPAKRSTWTTWTRAPRTMWGRRGFALGAKGRTVPQPLLNVAFPAEHRVLES